MPEGHSIHRLARDQQELVGCRVRASSPQGRFAEGAAVVDGCEVTAVRAVGKHLLHHTDAGTIHIHLGMQGKMLRFPSPNGKPLRQVRLRLASESVAWDLIAPSRCELLDEAGVTDLVGTLGPDPLDDEADVDEALRNLRDSGRSIGAALLDQHLVAGVGNVFRAEALLRTHLHPTFAAGELAEAELRELWDVLRTMMRQAVDDGEIRPKLVYKQPLCLQCDVGAAVETAEMEGRTVYVCPTCQPRVAA